MTSENPSPSTPATNTNTGTAKPPACNEWWSPTSGLLPDCPTQVDTSKASEGFSETKTADGTIIRKSLGYDSVNSAISKDVETITPDGTRTIESSEGNNKLTQIFLNNPGGVGTTYIDDSQAITQRKPSASFATSEGRETVDLEKKPYGYSGKDKDGTSITFYRDPTTDSPSSGNWVTETKDIEGKVTTVSRNNDRSFNIVTKNPDGTGSTALEKSDGSGTATDSRGIITTTNTDGTWFITYPKSADGSTKIYYSDGRTVIKKSDGTIVPQQ